MDENELLKSLKNDYDNIEIPDDLLSKVQDAISESKSGNAEAIIGKEKHDMNKMFSNNNSPINARKSKSISSDNADKVIKMKKDSKNKNDANVIVKDKDLDNLVTIKKNSGRRKSNKRYGWLAVAAALALFIILPNTSATVAHAMESVPVLGQIVKVITIREYKDDNGNVSADIKTPEVQQDSSNKNTNTADTMDNFQDSTGASSNTDSSVSNLNTELQKYTDEIIAQYEKDAKIQGSDGHENVTTDYTVVTDNDKLFALRFDTTVTMADSGQTVKIYNVDKQSGKILALSDMFQNGADYTSVLKEEILKQMKGNNKKDENNIYFATDPDMSDEINMDDEISKANFYVNKDGNLTIVFDKGTVAPMYMGVLEFTIGNDAIKDIKSTEYL